MNALHFLASLFRTTHRRSHSNRRSRPKTNHETVPAGHQRRDHLSLTQPCPPRGCATVVCAERRDRFSDLLDNPNRLRQDLIQSPAFTAQSVTPGEALDLLDRINDPVVGGNNAENGFARLTDAMTDHTGQGICSPGTSGAPLRWARRLAGVRPASHDHFQNHAKSSRLRAIRG